MSEIRVLSVSELQPGEKKVVKAGKTEVLLIRQEDGFVAVQPTCPHAGAPLEEGAVCNGRLVCPWHLGTFALPTGKLLEPPPMESLKTYSVRVEGEDVLLNTEPRDPMNAPLRHLSERTRFLLIGVGAAGAMAAVTLRQEGFGGKIIAVDPVQEEPVDRTQLSKDALGGEMPLDKLSISDLPAMGIERSNATVVRLNAATNEANLSNGVVIKFDKTLVATGGKPKRLEIAGGEFAHTIRHPGDVRRILDAAEKDKKVVIIGTSFIGLEAASALIGKGLHVTVLGRETLPFAKQFGELAAGALKKLHEGKGTKFVLGVEIVSVDSSGVTVRDGQRESHVPGDLVIMGVGVSPELDFEHDLPVAEQGGGIRTDSSLRAAQAVWVAGDIANVNGRRIEHWRVAQQHGRMAALGMLGQKENYDGVPFFWTYHFGKRFGYLGHAENWDETFVKGDVSGLQFMIFYIKKGRIRAVLNCGFESQMAALAEPMRGSLALDEALHLTA